MKDEIKEILDYFQKDVDKYEESKRYLMKKYGYDEETIDNISQHERHINIKKLLDYITNLQQENKSLKGSCKVLGEKDNGQRKAINKYIQENERLRNKNNWYKKQQFSNEKIVKRGIEICNDYKSRIERAVEYINNNPFINSMAKVSIMNILRGDNDERKSN